ncbi:MAG: chromosome segregation protein SMC [Alphaproteobacteria bacterium]|nr:chromosome segregation protein SMC [Alphaproteobacteria bacterium]
MIRFSKLRLNGFKSFIERGELDITVGLTGIVGPNGCGKSNLVEALRWCMGESSARKMRGSGMEDVIFNGTERRPARNFAEVTLTLDNQLREAPPQYNQHDEIEIIRRIARDKGSNYKINGKNARARDVQLLFADTMTGANSPSIVSQGRVSEIINAKPQDRRHVLEESAGVAGLYARRHEAEIRLRAAETNLTRLEDISESMTSRIDSLRRQARQAEKYKELNSEIRKLERQIAYVEWHQSKSQQQNALRIYDAAESMVAEKMKAVNALTQENNETKRNLPNLRSEHIKLTSTLHSQKLSLSRLEDEEGKITALLTDSREQLDRAENDLAYESKTLDENKTLLQKTEEEEKSLHAHLENEEDVLKPLEDEKAAKAQDVERLESAHEEALSTMLSSTAKIESLKNEHSNLVRRKERLEEKKTALTQSLESIANDLKAQPDVKALEQSITDKQKKIEIFDKTQTEIAEKIDALTAEKDAVNQVLKTIQQDVSALKAEKSTLERLLSQVDEMTVLDDIKANKGFELALSRALGDTLLASTNPDMNKIWRKNSANHEAKFSSDIKTLDKFVKAPNELSIALRHIGVVDDYEQGEEQQKQLSPGQSVVSISGDYWRWDGYHTKAEAADQISMHLQHKNRLEEIETDLSAKQKTLIKQEAAHEKIAADVQDLKEQIPNIQNQRHEEARALKTAENELAQTQFTLNRLAEKKVSTENDLTEHVNEITQLSKALEEKTALLSETEDLAANKHQDQVQELKDKLSEARAAYQDASIALDKQIQEQGRRKARMHAIVDERNALKNRTIRAAEQIKKLATLCEQLKKRIEDNKDRPQKLNDEKEKLLGALGNIEEECTKASDRLSTAEMSASEAEKKLKTAESELASAREERAAAQANVANAEEHLKTLRENIESNYHCQPNGLLNKAEYALDLDDSGQDVSKTYRRLREEKDSAIIRREKIGPVNLQAQEELNEIDAQLGSIMKEKEDVVLAIDELRKAINTLNAEARTRLIKTFDEVNEHFKALFTRLYRGGKAYLELVDSDDALDAGIEIFAQPPGKTLQSLSLMSGGEQTLASIALIFAMFLTNPSPICVLDEVDAPLDDANVDRVCDLLEEIAAHGHTRFLVITHHRLTMARMDRLYGVTMAEQGVSQLVSVDLQQELDFLDDVA